MNRPVVRHFRRLLLCTLSTALILLSYAVFPIVTANAQSSIGTGICTASSLTVRSKASTSGKKLGTIKKGASVTVYASQNGWYQIGYKNSTGWVSGKYIKYTAGKTTPSTPSTPTTPTTPSTPSDVIGKGVVKTSGSTLNVRSGPGTGYSSLGKVSNKTTLNIYQKQDSWYRVLFNGKTGWVMASYIVFTPTSPTTPTTPTAPTTQDPIVQAVSIYTYDQMIKDIASLKSRYDDKITVSSIGKSVENRNIPVLVVGNPNAANQILIHAGIHAREYMNPNLVMMQLEYMLANPSVVYDGQTLSQWMSDTCFHIIPMVNPDGTTISQTKSGSDNVMAICTLNLVTSSNLPTYLQQWKANANGVDLNNQFPSGWAEKLSVSKPANCDYKGESALSEPEAKALATYTQSHSFDVTVSYHSTGGIIYIEYPQASSSNNAKSRSLGNAISDLTGYRISSTELDDGAGYKDWALSTCGIPSVTVETGSVSCPLPLSQFSAIWDQNKNMWPVLVKWARAN